MRKSVKPLLVALVISLSTVILLGVYFKNGKKGDGVSYGYGIEPKEQAIIVGNVHSKYGPGEVFFENGKTVYVQRDQELLRRIADEENEAIPDGYHIKEIVVIH
ncbi:hypothetical protein D7Z26_02395 [Cohnella endophytica]|uniref:Uncharacterized protein n=1 Tax=Cohnella endophytica TaxID=2419778 RepID=A0A494Y4A5_9BACL|nr:hypothetical protein [Cohnella endophytica]RKP56860.1 hypothetical protein D7Z26_02395 [Cohnella endophytica]